jgi:hypothetical protein
MYGLAVPSKGLNSMLQLPAESAALGQLRRSGASLQQQQQQQQHQQQQQSMSNALHNNAFVGAAGWVGGIEAA